MEKVTPEMAHYLINGAKTTSAVGHEASAAAFRALGFDCQVNRIEAKMEKDDYAVCLKLRGRLPEGAIITLDEMEAIGFDLFLISHLDILLPGYELKITQRPAGGKRVVSKKTVQ